MKADLKWLEDPSIFRINQLKAHSDHMFYEKREEIWKDMPLLTNLNGEWKFSYAENLNLREKDFYKKDFDISGWDNIKVPGHMETQGYGQNQYINTMYAWDGIEDIHPPKVFSQNPVGSYVKEFELPKDYKGKRIILSFEGVSTAMYLWVNGKFTGYSEDSFTPSEFDITDLVCDGINRICVEVYKYSSASWIEDQDFFRFSGIFRDVNLYAIPKVHIEDIFVTSELSELFDKAKLDIRMKISGEYKGCHINVMCFDKGGQKKGEVYKIDADKNMDISLKIEYPVLWSCENPYRYEIIFEVYDKNENLLEIVPMHYGIRKFEISDGIMKLNGKRIIFRGVNRHEFHPKNGHVITKEDMLWDIFCMKRNNINADRTSHYPNQKLWYELCDKYGIYLIDENNLESHGTWQNLNILDPTYNVPSNLPEWNDNVVDRARSMFERDKNHASILMWSCGNESYAEEDIMNITRFFHDNDKTRIVHYESCFWNREYDCTSDVESRMYAKPDDIIEYLENAPEKPYISCEYMHAMGNSLGGMSLYTDLEDKYDKYQGGFIWDFMDQALWQKRKGGKEYLVYGGYHDERPTDYGFSTNGIVYANRKESPKMQEVKQLYSPIWLFPEKNGIKIRNRNLFIDTNDYDFVLQVEKEGEILWEKTINACVMPEEEMFIEVPYEIPKEAGEYLLNAYAITNKALPWANKGYEIAFGQTIMNNGIVNKENIKINNFRVVKGNINIGVMGDGFQVLFSKVSGGIVSLKYNNTEYITDCPKVTYWRASTDNDRGMKLHNTSSCYLAMTLGQMPVFDSYKVETSKDYCEISLKFQYPEFLSFGKEGHKVKYRITDDGQVHITLKYPGIEGLYTIPAFGMEFKLKERFSNMRYYGNGPLENYIDRNKGARLGVFETTASDNYSAYLKPQECGNRTCLRWMEITDDCGEGLRFESESENMEGSILPYSAMEMENAMLLDELSDSPYVYLRVLGAQSGVGGDDSWGAPVQKAYQIPSDKQIEFSFSIKSIK